jgi:ankyrin repeat protein
MSILASSLERDLIQAASDGEPERVSELIEAGVNPSALPSGCPEPALHSAAARAHLPIVKMLLAHGCPVDLPDSTGSTALALVVHTIAESPEGLDHERLFGVALELLRLGASPQAGRSREDTPIALARAYGLADLESKLLLHSDFPFSS